MRNKGCARLKEMSFHGVADQADGFEDDEVWLPGGFWWIVAAGTISNGPDPTAWQDQRGQEGALEPIPSPSVSALASGAISPGPAGN